MKNLKKLTNFLIFSILFIFAVTFVLYFTLYTNTLVKEIPGWKAGCGESRTSGLEEGV